MRARHARAAIAACAAALGWLAPAPGTAAVTRAEVSVVRDASGCGASACGSSAPSIGEDGVAAGPVEVSVAVEAQLPIDWVELEARLGTETVCLQRWALGDRLSFSGVFRWDTASWPNRPVNSDCLEESAHKHGTPTANGVIDLGVLVFERGAGAPVSSDAYAIDLANAPGPPEWLADPAVAGDVVKLRWAPPAAPDVVEYVIERAGPSGDRRARAVGAADPASAGCKTLPSIGIECEEGPFAEAGDHTFTVRARRPGTGGERCETTSGRCLDSEPTAARSVRYTPQAVDAPTVEVLPASPGPSASASALEAPDPREAASSTPFAPVHRAVGRTAEAPQTVPARPALIALASALAFLIGVAHRRLIPQKPDREAER